MFSIIKLRFLRLRDEYLIIVIMTIIALGFTAVFGMIGTSYKPRILIVDKDQSKHSKMFIDELESNPIFRYESVGYEEAIELVDKGKALSAVVINNGFSDSIDNGGEATIELIKFKDDRYIYTLEYQLFSILNRMIGNIKIAEITADYLVKSKNDVFRDEIVKRAYENIKEYWSYRKPININTEIIDTKNFSNYDSLMHSIIGFSIYFTTYTAVFSIGTILYDKEHNIWQRMLVSPISKSAILGGSMISAYIIGLLQLFILIFAGKYLFNIEWGLISGIILIALLYVFAITCLGLFLSGIVKTYAQLSAITPVILTGTAMLGGCMWPLEIVNNRFLLFLANFMPQKWAVEGMEKIAMYGYGFNSAIQSSIVLLVMGLVFFGLGVKMVQYE
ncbi:ABC transporter permease [Caloranaerobacter azorensis]|uniref:ABC transporter permease n=1 Tax=Caloranaerobacter azorensis TaxID=116090 RepID=A0A6P1YDW3_9FIRM|nr:ABC transporter permease [Caloranaerobacter azorensis]QIB27267.1 ABC transporter permease [Caloranaerobacter azorensis]